VTPQVPKARFLLVGNKSDCDPTKREVSFEEGLSLAQSLGASYVEASQLMFDNFKTMITSILRDLIVLA
jgi:hypothetical protein